MAHTIVLPCQFLDELLILIELLKIVAGHSINAEVLCAVDVVLIA